MGTTDPFNQEVLTAATKVTERLSDLAGEGLADSFFASLTFSDAHILADLAASTGDYLTARATLTCWEENDEDSDEYADELAEALADYASREHTN